MNLTPKQIIEFCQNRKKSYRFYINELKSVDSKESFDNLSKRLFDDIFDDEEFIFDLTFGKTIAKPVLDSLNEVRSVYKMVIQFYKDFKELRL